MALVFRELHKAKSPDMLNEEWLVLENTGPNPITFDSLLPCNLASEASVEVLRTGEFAQLSIAGRLSNTKN